MEPAVNALLDEARARLDALGKGSGERTYANTMDALEGVTERLDFVMGVVGHLESVATTPALRAAYNAVQPAVSELFSSIALSDEVWKALKAFAETSEAKALTGAKRRFVDKTIADFRRSGADLDPVGKKRLSAIDVELATLTLRYGQNVLDATNAFEIVVDDASRLAGLPESAVAAARAGAESKGRRATASASRRRATSPRSPTSTTARCASSSIARTARGPRRAISTTAPS